MAIRLAALTIPPASFQLVDVPTNTCQLACGVEEITEGLVLDEGSVSPSPIDARGSLDDESCFANSQRGGWMDRRPANSTRPFRAPARAPASLLLYRGGCRR